MARKQRKRCVVCNEKPAAYGNPTTRKKLFCRACAFKEGVEDHVIDLRVPASVSRKASHIQKGSGHHRFCGQKNCACTFASHPRSQFWHPNRNSVSPGEVPKASRSKYWFQCGSCSHDFEKVLASVSKGSWCPFCSSSWTHCGDEDCYFCFSRSFASHPLAQDWDYSLNDEHPLHVPKGSSKTYSFVCSLCKHSYQKILHSISTHNRLCPFCSPNYWNHCGSKDCEKCNSTSFASHPKSVYWDSEKNGFSRPENFGKGSAQKAWFLCDSCKGSFKTSIYSVSSGKWCSLCKHKTENKLRLWLKKQEFTVVYQARKKWCFNPHTKRILPFDFLLPELRTIVELDGDQHFRHVWNWETPQKIRDRDVYKMTTAFEKGYRIVRVYQRDVLYDITDWRQELLEKMREDGQYGFVRASQTNVNNVYQEFAQLVDGP